MLQPERYVGRIFWELRRIKPHKAIKLIEDIKVDEMTQIRRVFAHSEDLERKANIEIAKLEGEKKQIQSVQWLFHPNLNYELAIIVYTYNGEAR